MAEPLDPNREVYPRAPLKLVACEIAYTLAPGASVDAIQERFYEVLGEVYPLPGVAPQGVVVEMTPGAPPRTTTTPHGFRLLNREQTQSVVVSSQSVIVETSAYTKFEEFSQRVADVVTALAGVLRVAAAHRVGLRYIDEVPLHVLPKQRWDPYFSDAVLAPARPVPDVGSPVEFLTTCRYDLRNDRQVTMRTGLLNAPVVAADGPLSIHQPSSPPLMLLDIDSAWQAVTATTPRGFDAEELASLLMDLHAPVRALFEDSITDDLRNEVLRQKEAT